LNNVCIKINKLHYAVLGGAITGQPVVGYFIGDAELRQDLQYALTGADDSATYLNLCVTCDPQLCCGDCCLTCCNPTTKADMASVQYIASLILKVEEMCSITEH
jgi:hypothetical protein